MRYNCTVVTREGLLKTFVAENVTDAINYADQHFPRFKQLVALSGSTTIVKRGEEWRSNSVPSFDCSTVPSSESRVAVPKKSSINSVSKPTENTLWSWLAKWLLFIGRGA